VTDRAADEQPRRVPVAENARRAGVLTLLFGAVVLAGALLCVLPTSEHARSATVGWGAPLHAAFATERDYLLSYLDAQLPPGPAGNRRYADYVPDVPTGFTAAATQCIGSGRVRVAVGGGLVLVGVVVPLGIALARRRRPPS
jgi:hypothetical protein